MKFYRLLTIFIVVFFAFAFVSCQKTDSELDEIPSYLEVARVDENFDLSILLESENEEVRTRAQGTKFLPASKPIGVIDIWATPENPLLPAGDQTVTIQMDGLNVNDINIKVSEYLSGAPITTATIPALAGTVSFTIPAYIDPGDGQARNILIEYQNGGWNYLKIYVQSTTSSVPGTATFISNITSTIPYTGGSYTITATGTEPVSPNEARFQFVDESGNVVGEPVKMSPPARSVPFTINANTSTSPKRIRLQYSMDGVNYTTFETHDQLGAPITSQFRLWVDYDGVIPGTGATTTVRLEGDFTTSPTGVMIIKAMDATDSQPYSELYAISGTTQKSVDVRIYENSSNEARLVFYYYSLDYGVTWLPFDMKTQAANTNLQFDLSVNTTSIPAVGGTYTVTLTGNFTTSSTGEMHIRAISNTNVVSNSNVLFRGTVQKTSPITIDPNPFTDNRTVSFQYSLDDQRTWSEFQVVTQLGQTTTPNWYVTVNCNSIPQNGGPYMATLTGNVSGTVLVSAFSGSTDVANVMASLNNTDRNLYVYILPNPSTSSRNVTFKYSHNGGPWVEIKTVVQEGSSKPTHPGGNYCMTGLGAGTSYAALGNAGRGQWGASNCSSYSERSDGRDRGRWRIPGSGELMAMANAYLAGNPALAGMQPESLSVFWTNGISYTNTSYGTAIRINNGKAEAIANPKSSNHYYRCVIDVNPAAL